MLFAEKLSRLRKERGLTVEELASKLGISPRTVIKWEKGQSIPDIDKIVLLSDIFGVTTDMLLKDSTETDRISNTVHITYSEAKDYLKTKFGISRLIAIATFVIMLSPGIMLIIMSLPLRSDTLGNGLGLSALFIMVSVSISIFSYAHIKTERYDKLLKGNFTVDYNATDMLVKTEEKLYHSRVIRNTAASALCIISLLPTVLTALVPSSTSLAIMIALTSSLFIAGIGVVMFITSGMKRSALAAIKDTPRGEASYSKRLENAINGSFWTLTAAIYLLYSFTSGNWHMSWIIFIFAVAISGIISTAFSFVRRANNTGSQNDDKKDTK